MSITALIIDDEQLALDELKYLLDSAGDVDVLGQGHNGIEAVEMIRTLDPDLVFLDVQMPGLDGFAVLKKLLEKSHRDALPQIIFATAFDQYAVRAFDVNAIDYLLKPFDRARVLQAVERARQRIHELESQPAGSAALPGEVPSADARLDALIRLLEQQHAASPPLARVPSGKIVLQAQTRLLLVDQKDICFASIDDGTISVVTPTIEGQSKCRTLEELLELLDPAIVRGEHQSDQGSSAVVQEQLPVAHER